MDLTCSLAAEAAAEFRWAEADSACLEGLGSWITPASFSGREASHVNPFRSRTVNA